MLQTVIEGAYIITLAAVIFLTASVQNKGMFLFAVFAVALTANVIRLVRAIGFRKDLKDRQIITVSGVIKCAFRPARMISPFKTAHALAEYSVNGKTVKGWMIGVCDGRLKPNDTVTVIVNGRGLTMFAFSEKQVSAAVRSYAVFTVITAVFALATLFILFAELFAAST